MARKVAPGVKTIVVVPDTQIPYHSPKALQRVIDFIGETQPDEVVHIGDLVDFPQPSRWNKSSRGEFEGSIYKDSETTKRVFLEPLRRVYEGPVGVHEGNHDCLSDKARVVTRRGPVFHKDLQPDDQVLSVTDDGSAIWQEISEVVVYPFSGHLNTVESQRVAFEVTDNHRIVGKSRRGAWVEATPAFKGRVKVHTSGESTNEDADVTDTEIRLAVWALTDAYRTQYGVWEFYQAESKKDRIEELLTEMGLDYSVREATRNTKEIDGKELKNQPQKQFTFRLSKEASRVVSDLVAERYSLPEWFLQMSNRQAAVALAEWQYTDGTTPAHGNSVVLYVSNTPLREQLQTFLVSHGFSATAVEYRPGHFRLNVVQTSTTEIYAARMTKVEYEGDVWCLRVPNGRFFVEQDGKMHLTGNSRPREYLEKYAPALAESNAFDVDQLLDFDGFGVDLLPEFYDIAPGWISTHGHRGGIRLSQISGSTALNAAKKFGKSVVCGHTHRLGLSHFSSGYDGRTTVDVSGMEVGNLMDMRKAQYLKGGTANWKQGFGIFQVDGKVVKPEIVPISKGAFIVGGETWKI